jgi:biopolymer transport protein ExbD
MATNTSGTRALNAEPNITPMIDVLLVLLVIFLFKVPQLRRTLDVQLPDPAATQGESAGIVLEVEPGPRFAVNRQVVSAAQLGARVIGLDPRRDVGRR